MSAPSDHARPSAAAGTTADAAANPVLVELWRGPVLESRHRGRIAVATADGRIVAGAGDTAALVLPRSAAKPLQALALVESGAADAAGLTGTELALATASHAATAAHVARVERWLATIGLDETALRCGAHPPLDEDAAEALRRAGTPPDQRHNNCSGKHAGFLTLGRHLGAGAATAPDYVAIDHPVQRAVAAALAETTGAALDAWAIDGCSAPNHAMPLAALATGFARLAAPATLGRVRAEAARRLTAAMAAHPLLVSGPGRATARMLAAARDGAIVKSGAEGVYAAALPARGLGIAVKIDDGDGLAATSAIAAVLAAFGALDPADPDVAGLIDRPLHNSRGTLHGRLAATALPRRLAAD